MNIYTENFNEQTLITFEEGSFKVVFSTLGASFVDIKSGKDHLIYSPVDKNDMLAPDFYHGKTIGPICNRIEKGIVYINGKKYVMAPNEGENTLHGGVNGISHKYFTYKIDKNENSVTFTYNKKAFEDELPGNVIYTVKYIVKHMEIQLFYDVTSDEDTIISLTNHVYICLDAKDVKKISFQAPCDTYVVPRKEDLIALNVEKVPYYLDFNQTTCFGDNLYLDILQNSRTKGFDHNLIFKKGLERHIVSVEDNKYKMFIESNYPSVQIYTDNYEDQHPFIDINLKKHGSVAIEPCDIITERPILRKDEHYLRNIIYSIKEK